MQKIDDLCEVTPVKKRVPKITLHTVEEVDAFLVRLERGDTDWSEILTDVTFFGFSGFTKVDYDHSRLIGINTLLRRVDPSKFESPYIAALVLRSTTSYKHLLGEWIPCRDRLWEFLADNPKRGHIMRGLKHEIKMVQLRLQRGTLDESVKTVVEIEGTRKALIEYIRSIAAPDMVKFADSDVMVTPYGHDPRIGWNTSIVAIDGYGIFGFVNGVIEE